MQRLLWASTGVKDKAYDDTRYVVELAAPDTVNTMPAATLDAVVDHGRPRGNTIAGTYDAARVVFADLQRMGIDFADVVTGLEETGPRLLRQELGRADRLRHQPAGEGGRRGHAGRCSEADRRQRSERVWPRVGCAQPDRGGINRSPVRLGAGRPLPPRVRKAARPA